MEIGKTKHNNKIVVGRKIVAQVVNFKYQGVMLNNIKEINK